VAPSAVLAAALPSSHATDTFLTHLEPDSRLDVDSGLDFEYYSDAFHHPTLWSIGWNVAGNNMQQS
jgi:hypothetical protein